MLRGGVTAVVRCINKKRNFIILDVGRSLLRKKNIAKIVCNGVELIPEENVSEK
jgi:hypothetical protein